MRIETNNVGARLSEYKYVHYIALLISQRSSSYSTSKKPRHAQTIRGVSQLAVGMQHMSLSYRGKSMFKIL